MIQSEQLNIISEAICELENWDYDGGYYEAQHLISRLRELYTAISNIQTKSVDQVDLLQYPNSKIGD